ncbi:MAG: hypothetical protein PHN44_10855 [Candidatus Marinimicrobia bacterium]|jgi:hypothetical protein|nr:hypothetical protein [Candidatus Neomarinimicrobiota bacterium]MDD5539923.1 hypothetical protein [Candidatus Neomarinimicrobiota bacterium]
MKFRFAKDKWLSKEYTFAHSGLLAYDKFQHFVGGMVVCIIGTFVSKSIAVGVICSAIFWFLWEVKDGILRYEECQYVTHWPIWYNWGAEGFSWRDMVAAWLGAGMAVFIIGAIF